MGQGNFGRVYLVRNLRTGKKWACKTAQTKREKELLKREGKLLKELSHPLFAAYEEWWENDRGGFLVMERIEGEGLETIRSGGRLSQGEAVSYGIQIAEGISYLHKLPVPVLYRDLKPEHIKVENGRVRLFDLGCACRITEAFMTKAGTKGYASPEQLSGGLMGVYSDVYAFGKLLEYMLTEEHLFLKELIRACTEKNYQNRMQDMDCVLYNLRKWGMEERFLWKKTEIF